MVLPVGEGELHATAMAHPAIGPVGRRVRREHGIRLPELGEGVPLGLQDGHGVLQRMIILIVSHHM